MKTIIKWRFTLFLLVVFGVFLAVERFQDAAALAKKQVNLASQISPVTVTIVPYISESGQALRIASFHFTNNGPKEVGAVYANLTVRNASGAETNDTIKNYRIYAAQTPWDTLKPGERYNPLPGYGYLLQGDGNAELFAQAASVPRVDVVVTRAEEDTGLQSPP